MEEEGSEGLRDQTIQLRANIRVNVIQRMFNGFVSSFKSAEADSEELIQYWFQTVPGLRQRFADYVHRKSEVGAGVKASLRTLSASDKNRVVDMFESEDAYEGTDCEFAGPRRLDMYVMCVLFLFSRRKQSLPKTKKADRHGLWVAFKDMFPDTYAAEEGAAQQSEPKPKKRNLTEVDAEVEQLKKRVLLMEQSFREQQNQSQTARRNSL